MFDNRWRSEERSDDGTPLGKGVRLPETDSMVFQRVPEHLQDVAFGALQTPVDLVALKALGVANHGAQAPLDGFFKSGVLAGLDADIGEFENHGAGVSEEGLGCVQGIHVNGLVSAPRCVILIVMNSLPEQRADWLIPDWSAPSNVRALCTTRSGGVSVSPFDSLNLGSHVGDRADAVVRNRDVLQHATGARPVFLNQVHGTKMLALTPDTPDNLSADGTLACEPGLACTIMVADCLPILLCDAAGSMVAAVHAGWRGLAGMDGMGVVERVQEHFAAQALVKYRDDAIEVIAWLGPCIGPDAFEVGSDVVAAFAATAPQARDCFTPLAGGKWLADLPALARQRLRQVGISRVFGNDGSAPWCTVGNPLRFFSHRRDRVSGRQAACIWLE